MAQDEPSTAAEPAAASGPAPVVVKKYANRRLYNTESSSYVTLEDLAVIVRAGRDFVVYDAKSGDDITRGVLTQIIVEEESKGRHLLPTSFLRQIIGFYGDSVQSLVPKYLENVMGSFARQHDQVRRTVEQTMGGFMPMPMPFALEEVSKQNMAMMERAMTLFAPFRPNAPEGEGDAARMAALQAEIALLRAELAVLKPQAADRAGE
jgi:polyhydroxyalkanoate synthesis repressor PhaR